MIKNSLAALRIAKLYDIVQLSNTLRRMKHRNELDDKRVSREASLNI